MSEWGDRLTLLWSHPVTNKVNVMATLSQERKCTLWFLVPVASDKRMGKMPITNLKENRNLDALHPSLVPACWNTSTPLIHLIHLLCTNYTSWCLLILFENCSWTFILFYIYFMYMWMRVTVNFFRKILYIDMLGNKFPT